MTPGVGVSLSLVAARREHLRRQLPRPRMWDGVKGQGINSAPAAEAEGD